MQRIRKWIKQLSLSQQLFALIFFFIAFFASFFFLYLSENVEKFINDQMYGVLDRSQQYVEIFYASGYPIESLLKLRDDEVQNFIFTRDYRLYGSETIPSDELLTNIEKNLRAPSSTNGFYIFEIDSRFTYYKIVRLDSDYYLVTMIDDASRVDFRNGLLNSIINTIVLVVGGFFIVIMIWMGYLIHPLNQIRNYIEKIKKGDTKATLKIHREDEIGELASALVKMQEEIERQEKVKEEMVHNISHDLKTPIATIKSYAESVKDGIYPYGTLEKSIDVIIDNATRLEKKVHSLLYLNRIDYIIQNDDNQGETDMKKVIQSIAMNAKVRKPEINIITHLDSVSFPGAEEPWRVAIENIVDNGQRYAKSTIVITLNKKELTIENDGPPISNDRLAAMFKPFEKGTDGQFGLGLSIVQKVVSANGYKVECGNTAEGVIFRIYPM